MPAKRPKPKWGYRSKGMLEDYGKKHYSLDQATKLSTMLGENVPVEKIMRAFDNAANQYFWSKSSYDDGPTHAESKEALKVTKKHAQNLLECLEKLDDKSWNIVLEPETEATYRLGDEDQVMTKLGYEIVGERQPDGSLAYEVLGPEDFVGAAEFIEFYLSYAFENYPKGSAGKKRLLSLSGWLNHIQTIWTENSGKKFTLDFHKGQGVSEAFMFCKEVIAIIDPKVTEANLITAMRDKIKNKH